MSRRRVHVVRVHVERWTRPDGEHVTHVLHIEGAGVCWDGGVRQVLDVLRLPRLRHDRR